MIQYWFSVNVMRGRGEWNTEKRRQDKISEDVRTVVCVTRVEHELYAKTSRCPDSRRCVDPACPPILRQEHQEVNRDPIQQPFRTRIIGHPLSSLNGVLQVHSIYYSLSSLRSIGLVDSAMLDIFEWHEDSSSSFQLRSCL